MSAHNDSAFLRMFLFILAALVAFTVIIIILANKITGTVEEARGPDPRLHAIVAERIKPVGSVNVATAAAAAPAAPQSGADVVAAACNSCHVSGVLGAPKVGDAAAWQQRLGAAGGVDGLTSSAINGKGAMPPKGGAMVSDDEIRAAVEHMLSESGVDVATAAAPAAEPVAEPAVEQTAETGPVEAVKQMADNAVDVTKSAVAAVTGMLPGAAPEAAAAEAAAAEQQAAPAAAAPQADLANGKSVYATACFVCHTTGVAGAPKLGDKAVWVPRIAKGMDVLVDHAINGLNAMPPKGGRTDLSDAAVADAVAYMIEESN